MAKPTTVGSDSLGGPALRPVAFDTETYLIEPGNLAPKLVCLSYFEESDQGLLLAEDGVGWLRTQLKDPSVVLVGHNIAFDFGVALAYSPGLLPLVFRAYEEGRVRDSMVRDKVLLRAQGSLSYDFKNGN